jgi:hypothetical protein
LQSSARIAKITKQPFCFVVSRESFGGLPQLGKCVAHACLAASLPEDPLLGSDAHLRFLARGREENR